MKKYLPYIAGGAALGYGLRRGQRANSPSDLWGSDRTSRSLPSPRYSSLVYHCGSRGPGERFSLDDFGSGEGYATFGKGIYFSSRRSVAERYCKYVDWPELTVAVITKPLLDGKPRGGTGDWNCVKCSPNRFGTPCWCPKGVLAAGYAGVRVTETTGSKWFAEIVVYDPSAIQVVKTIDRTAEVDEELRETARTQGEEQASRYPRYRPALAPQKRPAVVPKKTERKQEPKVDAPEFFMHTQRGGRKWEIVREPLSRWDTSQAEALRDYRQVLYAIPHAITITDGMGKKARLLLKPRESQLDLYTLWDEDEEWFRHQPRFELVWRGKEGGTRVKAEVWVSYNPDSPIHVGGRLGNIEVRDGWEALTPLTTPPRWPIDREVGPGSFFTLFRDDGVEVDWDDPRNQSRSRAKRAAIAAKNVYTDHPDDRKKKR